MAEGQMDVERIDYVLVDKDSLEPYKTENGKELRFPTQGEAAEQQQKLSKKVREQLIIYRDVIEKEAENE